MLKITCKQEIILKEFLLQFVFIDPFNIGNLIQMNLGFFQQ